MVANEWKDENDKVMPVRQWLEERRLLQVFPLSEKVLGSRFRIHLFIFCHLDILKVSWASMTNHIPIWSRLRCRD